CCPPNTACVNGICQCVPRKCPPGVCGTFSDGCGGELICDCPPPLVCVDGVCCPEGQVCGNPATGEKVCCPPDQPCLSGHCCPKEQICGALGTPQVCCPPGRPCIDGVCCPTQQICGAAGKKICCPPGTFCNNSSGSCEKV